MILKFRVGQTDWKLIEGFKEIHYFNVKKVASNKSDDDKLSIQNDNNDWYAAWGEEERFNPSCIYHLRLGNIPIKDIGVIGKMKDPNDVDMFLLLGADDVFILNDEGKTIERI
jgi:hypothetical protein